MKLKKKASMKAQPPPQSSADKEKVLEIQSQIEEPKAKLALAEEHVAAEKTKNIQP